MKILYLGISGEGFARSRVHIDGLRQSGVEVFEFFDKSKGLLKFKNFYKFLKIHQDADLVIIGNPGEILVPFVKMVSKKPIIFDVGWSLFESEIISRRYGKIFSLTSLKFWFMGFLACLFSKKILLESLEQVKFFERTFFAKGKCQRLYTGAEEDYFFPRQRQQNETFIVMFRGGYLPEAGINFILDAANILKNHNDIKFRILGNGFVFKEIKGKFDALNLANVIFESKKFIDKKEMADDMCTADVSLGQLSDHSRLSRTIPHKAFEFTSLGICYLTAKAQGVEEFLESDGAFYSNPADANDLAKNILLLKTDRKLLESISKKGREIFLRKASSKVLGKELLLICKDVLTITKSSH